MANNLEMLSLCKNDYNNVINNKDNYNDLITYGTIFLDSAEKLQINIKDRKYADADIHKDLYYHIHRANDFLEMLMSRYPRHMYSRLSLENIDKVYNVVLEIEKRYFKEQ